MSPGVEIDADRIATAVQAQPHIAGLHSGRFGEIATLLRGRRIPGIRVREDEITIGVTGRYPATAVEISDDVRAAVGPVGLPVHVRIGDIAPAPTGTAKEKS
ncbi:hypothetical protein P3102_25360 [Amycolatopsis sp. QT-25]|uniref:hypothetical protein n=1 Tax=Amycolatopsis sp. QT-25 TaxID=3034022 RepID=UPI0023EC23D3|nr:hypothetical protein [Amycolatopsis sp. QT-25]WET77400.1 hypothetical protein P3102_25360 [Amycolatopsis sp. QT-25]HET6290532.1 hypothetical protein [Amycolatopsis sp.]